MNSLSLRALVSTHLAKPLILLPLPQGEGGGEEDRTSFLQRLAGHFAVWGKWFYRKKTIVDPLNLNLSLRERGLV